MTETVLVWEPADDAERFADEGKLGKDVYCLPLFQDSLSEEPYIGTSLVVYNRGAWRNPHTNEVLLSLSHFAILPIYPLRNKG